MVRRKLICPSATRQKEEKMKGSSGMFTIAREETEEIARGLECLAVNWNPIDFSGMSCTHSLK